MKEFLKKHKTAVIISAAIIIIVALTVSLFTVLKRNADLNKAQAEFIEKLELTAGSYDENNIVLSSTNRYEAEALAEKLGADLRISFDGRFAVLYLRDGNTILDVGKNADNVKYLSAMSPDYYVKAADMADASEEEYIKYPSTPVCDVQDPYFKYQEYLNYLNLGSAMNELRGTGLKIAIIDSGIDTDHPEFAGRISPYSYNATTDKIVKDWDDWSLIEDEYGHGTSVAGVISAAANGVGMTGLCPDAELIIIKARCYEGLFNISDLVFGFYYAIERDVDVINMSFSFSKVVPDPFAEPALLAYDSDIICIAASGNDTTAQSCMPASTEYVFGVGALDEGSWDIASYSNFGDNNEVMAPGTVFTTVMGGGYGYKKGTSFSAPIVSSIALMYKQAFGKYITNDDFSERLHASCYDLGEPGPDFYYGYGAIDVGALIYEPTGTVTYNMMTDELDDTEGLIVYGHPIQDIPEPERLYSIFDGWYYDPQCTEELNWYEDSYNSDITLYAKWANEDDTIPYKYRILDDDTVEILGYIGKRRYITIPDYIEGRQVSGIGDGAFAGERNLRRIILPHYLKYIGDSAFSGCKNIVTFSLPTGVLTIGEYAFENCVRMTSITLGDSLQSVGKCAFYNCGLLTSIYLPETVSSVNGTAFVGCKSMTAILTGDNNGYFMSIDGVLYSRTKTTLVAFPAAVTGIYALRDETVNVGICAFCGSSITHIDLNKVEVIGASAFCGASLMDLYIPDTCYSLGEAAFASCSIETLRLNRLIESIPESAFSINRIKDLFIPKEVKIIKKEAFSYAVTETLMFEEGSKLNSVVTKSFYGEGIKELVLPPSLVSIGESAFSGCMDLQSVSFGEGSQLQTIGSRAFYNDMSLTSVELPDTLRIIGGFCFSCCGFENEVYIPASVADYGAGAFAECTALADIRVDEDNVYYTDIDGVVYSKDRTYLVEYPAGREETEYAPADTTLIVGMYSFYGNLNLTNLVMPDSVVTVEDNAFEGCAAMTEYRLSESLEYIGHYAFSKNTDLVSIVIPDSVIQLGRFCFSGSFRLKTVLISDNSRMARLGMQCLSYCGLEEFRIPPSISTVSQFVFEGCKRLTKVTFPKNSKLDYITAYFFNGCTSIEELIFEEGCQIRSIQAHGFEGLTALRNANLEVLPIENIDNYAFRNCPELTDLTLPDSVQNVGRFAFYRCRSLRSLVLPEGLEHIGAYAFFGTDEFSLYFKSETLPIYLDENWDAGVTGYYTGVTETVSDGDWEYAVLRDGTVAVMKYTGTDKDIDLSAFPAGSVKIIGGYAFAYTGIENIVLPDTLEQIQRYAFAECTSLKSVVIPENVTFIAQYAFYKTGINSLTFEGGGLKVIEQYAFSDTANLKTVTVPGTLEKLGKGVFFKSGIESVSFGEGFSLDTIPENTFAETKLKTFTVPTCVKVLDHNAFSHNKELKSVDLGASEELYLMSYAFYNTGLTEFYVGKNISFIDEYALMDLDGVTGFEGDPDNGYYTVEDGVIYNKNKTKIIVVPSGKTGSFVIPKEIEVIGFGAFENSKLSSISIEQGSALVTLGYRAFYGAKNITELTVPKGVVSIDYYAFAECDKLKTVIFEEGNRLSGIYEGAFFGCRSLENITLPDTLVEISDYAFYACESLDHLPLTENTSVLGIYSNAFAYTAIADLELPRGLYEVGAYAFRGIPIREFTLDPEDLRIFRWEIGVFADCTKIESITLPFTGASLDDRYNRWFGFVFGSDYPLYDPEFVPESLKNITITVQKIFSEQSPGDDSWRSFYRLRHVETVVLPEDTYYIGPETFMDFESLKEFEIPHLLTAIEDFTFYNCGSLKEAVMPDGINYIGTDAFSWCVSLEKIKLNDGLKQIRGRGLINGVFRACPFDEIYLPDTLEFIGQNAFLECKNIKSVVVPANVEFYDTSCMFCRCSSLEYVEMHCDTIGDSMFSDCVSLVTANLTGDIRSIGAEAFAGCVKLENVNIPEHLEVIGVGAFASCESLEIDLVLPEGLREVGTGAFNSSGITSVVIPSTVTDIGESFRFCKNNKRIEIKAPIKIYKATSFEGNDNLEEVILPDTLEVIEDRAFFDYSKLKIRELPPNLRIIGAKAFAECKNIVEIVLPESLISIGEGAFEDCDIYSIINNSDINIGFTPEDYQTISARMRIIDKDGEHYRDDGHTYVITEDGMFMDKGFDHETGRDFYDLLGYCGSEKEWNVPAEYNGGDIHVVLWKIGTPGVNVIIPEGVGAITLLYSCDVYRLTLPSTMQMLILDPDLAPKIEYITVADGCETYSSPNGLLCQGDQVIYCPYGLRKADIPEGITSIKDNAFAERKIREVSFPDTLTEIGVNAFGGCDKLKEIELPKNIQTLGEAAFYGCSSVTSVDFSMLETIPDAAFQACGFEKIVIPGTVKTVGIAAFANTKAKEIVIEEGVENIDESAFRGNYEAEIISLPSSLKSIGESAFGGCCPDVEIHIPAGVEYIGDNAFLGIENVTIDPDNTDYILYDGVLYQADGTRVIWAGKDAKTVTLLPTIKEVSDYLFDGNVTIEKVVIPEGVTKIGDRVFGGCFDLKEVVLPDTLEYIGDNVWSGTQIKELYLSASVSYIGSLPDGLQHITLDENNPIFFMRDGVLYRRGEADFAWGYYVDSISTFYATGEAPKTLVIPEGVNNIGDGSFAGVTGSSVKKVVFPSTLKRIGNEAFSGAQLEEIDWADSNVEFIDAWAFRATKLNELIIPESVVRVGYHLYPWDYRSIAENCPNLTKIYIPAGADHLEDGFGGCTSLKEITVSPNNETYYSLDNLVYLRSTDELCIVPYVFDGTLVLPDTLKVIPQKAFIERTGLTSIILPESVYYIDREAFTRSGLTSIRIPAGTIYLDKTAFADCLYLMLVENESSEDYYPGCETFAKSLVVINRGVSSDTILSNWKYYISGEYICSLYAGCDPEVTDRYRVNAYLGDLTELTLPTAIDGHQVVPFRFEPGTAATLRIADGVTKIPDNAFEGSITLKKVILPDSVREFGKSVFSDSSLTEINIPEGTRRIGDRMFSSCGDLYSITLPGTLEEIGKYAFWRCVSLKTVDLPDSLIYIDEYAFSASGLEHIDLPKHLDYIGFSAFYSTKLKSVAIPDSVTWIEGYTFGRCEFLNEIILPDTGLYIGSDILGKKDREDPETAYLINEDNWDGDFLYIGNHLIRYRGNDTYVVVERDVKSIARDAFGGCSKVRYLEIAGDGKGSLRPENLPSLEMLIIRTTPVEPIYKYFIRPDYNPDYEGPADIPDTLRSVIIGTSCRVEHREEFAYIEDIMIFVENDKSNAPFDRIAPGWNNNNIVTYGDKWYMASFYDQNGGVISKECFRNTQVIRPPYVVLPKSGDTAYTHVGWDLDGDGEPDGLPASRLSDVEAYAVVRTSKPAYYTVKFVDIDRITILERYTLEYGQPIIPPEHIPEKQGYTFLGWENFKEGDTVSEDIKIYSVWKHDGDGHKYAESTVEPTCLDRGYTLHKCIICGDEYRTDYVDANWHTFGDWIIDKEPTCSEGGERHRICVICGFEEKARIDTTGHAYISTVTKEATCTESGIVTHECSVCGAKAQESIAKKEHSYQRVYADENYIKWLDAEFFGVVWGCEGETYWYYTCEYCGRIENTDTAKASAAGSGHSHVYDAILNAEGRPVAVRCALCGYVECHEHDCYDSTDENGHPVCICKNCGQVFPKITIIYGDATGDGDINGKDLIRLRKYLASYDPDAGASDVEIAEGADVNGDGVVNGKDLIRLRKYLAEYDDDSGESPIILGPDSTAAPEEFMILTVTDKRLL